jgi:hypothetical protein
MAQRKYNSKWGEGYVRRFFSILVSIFLTGLVQADIKRTVSGNPDLSGFYDSGTLTPLNRPKEFGEKKFMTLAEAEILKKMSGLLQSDADKVSDPNREALPSGGDGEHGFGAGGVGGYNSFWVDPGSDVSEFNGQIRTSIFYKPANGHQPILTPKGMQAMADNFSSFAYTNDGTASWLTKGGHGPFDGPEDLALAERCLLGFSAGLPSLPGLYNNYKRIVQTEDHVMILLEMVHDARVTRMNSKHGPASHCSWLGDAIGRWEGDTLVVETTNFRNQTGFYGGDENLYVIGRFTLKEDGNLLYDFTVNDDTAWTQPWSCAYVWQTSQDKVYDYACHEGNYAMGNILRGARLLENEALAEQAAK